jgi:hypothetical protein
MITDLDRYEATLHEVKKLLNLTQNHGIYPAITSTTRKMDPNLSSYQDYCEIAFADFKGGDLLLSILDDRTVLAEYANKIGKFTIRPGTTVGLLWSGWRSK